MKSNKPNLEVFGFPDSAITGSLGDLARVLASGTEVPEEFIFASALTVMGAAVGTRLGLDIGADVEPRFYTVLLGESYGVKKSTAVRKTIDFFKERVYGEGVHPHTIIYGVGSAEGLARELNENPRSILVYDELRALVDKTQVKGSTLLSMVTSLFEGTTWQNAVRATRSSVVLTDAHVSILACCTTGTYDDLWKRDAIAIGLPNRLFVINADRKTKVAWPDPPDPKKLEAVAQRIKEQLSRLPQTLAITQGGKDGWENWYKGLPNSEHVRRLDTIGFRLLGLIALTTDKTEIDEETVATVVSILNYELNLRILTDPIDADSTVARLEERIRRVLQRNSLDPRKLRQRVHADRSGLWAFDKALDNLQKVSREVELRQGKYHLVDDDQKAA